MSDIPDMPKNRIRQQRHAIATAIREIFSLRTHPPIAWVVLAVSLAITAIAYQIAEGFVTRNAEDRFRFETADIKTAIAKRMQDQEEVLTGGVALFAASNEVDRNEWRAYVESLSIARYYPGLQGFGFARQVAPADLDDHIEEVRNEGFPEFSVRPSGPRDIYTSIVFLEPFDWRNRRAFGFDMFSEPTRRAAMERARDTGRAAVSGAVTLVQETKTDIQQGFLMYLPVYRNGTPTETVSQRREALHGYVYSPFRMTDLMEGILGTKNKRIDYAIFDGAEQIENLLYASAEQADIDYAPQFERHEALLVGGREWSIKFTADSGYISAAAHSQPIFIAAGGLLIDFLVFIIIGSISRHHDRAATMAIRMTSKLRDQTEKTRAVFDTMVDGVLTLNEDGTIQSVNPAATRIFGYEPGELLTKNVNELMPNAWDRWLSDRQSGAENSGINDVRSSGDEVLGVRKNGTTFPVDLAVSRMKPNGRTMFTGLVRDITERKRIETLKNEFVSVVSHELRTPLTSLVGALQVVETGALGEIPEAAKELLSIANQSGERLTLLVNDILDMQKIEAGQFEFRLVTTEIVGLLQSSIAECEPYAAKYNVTIRLESEFEQAYVDADGGRMVQVMLNLISNAAKFSPEGGEVLVSARLNARQVRIAVSDSGPGIPAELRALVFEKFQQLDSSASRHREGSGLGLSVAQAIVKRHGSEICVGEAASGGAEFSFELPENEQVEWRDAAPEREVA